jgi:hypothetical protein
MGEVLAVAARFGTAQSERAAYSFFQISSRFSSIGPTIRNGALPALTRKRMQCGNISKPRSGQCRNGSIFCENFFFWIWPPAQTRGGDE